MSSHPLRDLAAQLRKVCRDHSAYTQAVEIVENCAGHLEAVARTHEANEEIRTFERRVMWLETEADPAGTTATNFRLTEENKNLRRECENLTKSTLWPHPDFWWQS